MSRATLKAIQAAAGNAGAGATYVDDVFSTYLYTGNGGSQGIPNGINLGDFGVGTSTRFNGTSDFLSRSSDLSGNADGKTFTFSCWVFLPPMDNRAGNVNQRVLYATDSSDNGIAINVDSSGQLGIEAGDGSGSWRLQATASTVIGTNVWTHILVSVDMANSSNRYVYLNDVAASVTWNLYTNTNLDFTRSTHYIGVWGNGTSRYFYDDMAHFYLDYTYRDLSIESNRRIFIDANGGSTSASSLAALNPIMYLPMTTAYAVGKNAGTGGDFTVNGSPTIVENGTEYVADSGKGGLTWFKARNDTTFHILFDTERGGTKWLNSGSSAAEATASPAWITYNSNGFTLPQAINGLNNTQEMVSWTFRKQPGFFDVVTYTGDGVAGREIPHNLGSVPGMILVKRTVGGTNDWQVYHRSLGATKNIILNDTAGSIVSSIRWNDTEPTSTVFTVGNYDAVNGSGDSYVAYLFAHDAQEFGTDSDEAIIKCGSYTGTGSFSSPPVINLGFEPQWVMLKNTTSSGPWVMCDVMRGATSQIIGTAGNAQRLDANSFNAETAYTGGYIPVSPTATGFTMSIDGSEANASGATYIYVAIRRPNKPASEFAATDLFGMAAQAPAVSGSTGGWNAGFVADMALKFEEALANHDINSRLTGTEVLYTDAISIGSASATSEWDYQEGFGTSSVTYSPHKKALFRRAPVFFDVVTYTGNVTAGRQIPHNLGVAPELILAKTRDAANYWVTYDAVSGPTKFMILNANNGTQTSIDHWNNTTPTASVVTLGDGNYTNRSNTKQILYLFASVSGISKVGSYTGTGNDLNVDCGFTSGARFVLVKRTDSTGDWYVWNYLFGIVAGNDPYSLLNTSAAPVTNTDYIDPLSSGFTITSTAPAALNASGGTYIFYAIA